MSCGFPETKVKLPIPEPDLPKVPEPPPLPDYSWGKDLGIDIDAKPPPLPLPEPDLPKVPEVPVPPPLPCPFDEKV